MRFFSFLLFVFSSNLIYSQSFAEADTHFDRFEYVETIAVLEALEKTSSFELDQLKQLGYSYYAIGDFEKALPIIDSVLTIKPIEPYFYYLQAESSLALGQIEKATQAYALYTQEDGSIDVGLRTTSASEITSWPSLEIDRIAESSFNENIATVLGAGVANGNFIFKEVGVNKSGEFLSAEQPISDAELFLMRPFVGDDMLTPLSVAGIEKFWSVHDVSIEPNTNKALISISKPLDPKESERMMRIYEGTYNADNNQIEVVKPWSALESENYITAGFTSYNDAATLLAFAMAADSTEGVDLFWMTKNNDGTWGSLAAINEVNSSQDDVYPRFIGDSLLSFSSNGRVGYGGLDIFQVAVDQNEVVDGSLVRLPFPVNSYRDDYNMQYTGDSLISLTSNRLATTSDDNIFHIYLPIEEEPIVEPPVDPNAEFLAGWEIKYLYFDFDKFSILRDSKEVDFEGLKSFLAANPDYKIELIGKTDNRGTEEYNYQLGLKRAESVKNELVEFGFNGTQINLISKGMNDPLVDCSNSWGCSEEDHAKNRVVMIELIH
jgi:hypothetical protein